MSRLTTLALSVNLETHQGLVRILAPVVVAVAVHLLIMTAFQISVRSVLTVVPVVVAHLGQLWEAQGHPLLEMMVGPEEVQAVEAVAVLER